MATPFEYHNNKLGVKVKFLISTKTKVEESLSFMSYRSLKKRMDSETCTEQQLRAGSYSYDSLILFSSLDQKWKDAITTTFGEPEKKVAENYFASHYTADRKAFDFYSAFTYGEENEKRLTPELIELYTYQASVLNAVLNVKANRKAYSKALGITQLDIWQSLSRDVNAFRKVDHKLPTHKNSLRKKTNDYLNESYSVLVSKKIFNKNAAKISVKEQTAILDELIAKHTNLDNTLISTVYNAIGDQQGWKKITSQTVANRKAKSNLITFAGRNGSKKLKSKMLMQHKRSAPSNAMLYWTLDGWDSELLFQQVVTDGKGHKRTTYHNRLTMVVILDPFNKYPIGYAIGDNESPALIKKAIQNAFNHTNELLGSYYKPFQMQSDNYAIKTLKPLYEACCNVFTPASVGNAKAKVIEPYFGYINKKYCKLYDNWSGHNVDSGSKSQPNDEMLNKLRHSFPDRDGVVRQLERVIDTERTSKHEAFVNSFQNVSEEHISEMSAEQYLFVFGDHSAKTIKMRGEGLRMQVDGVKRFYDSFDIAFRKLTDQNWFVHFDQNNMTQVLAVSECGSHRFLMTEKYVEPMAIADRKPADEIKSIEINDFNKNILNVITSTRQESAEIVDTFFSTNPHLNDTLAKHLLVDSQGQHKVPKQALNTSKAAPIEIEIESIQPTEQPSASKPEGYYESKVDISEYLQS